MPSVQSVHVPRAMNTISVVGRKRQVYNLLTMNDIHNYAVIKGISFIAAYRILASDLLANKEKSNAVC